MSQDKRKQVLFEASVIISMVSFGSWLIIGLMVLIKTDNIFSGMVWISIAIANLVVMYKLIKDHKDSDKEVFVINNAESNELSKFGNKLLDGFKKK